MPYQSSSYQASARSRRQGYENLSQQNSPGTSSGPAKMQTMEISSDGEYGSAFDGSSHGGMLNRWFIYGCFTFLVLIIVLVTHPVDTENSNLNLPNNNNVNNKNTATTTSAPTAAPTADENQGDKWVISTEAVGEEEEENPTEFYFDICNVPKSYRRSHDGFMYLNMTNYCLPEDQLASPNSGCGCLNPVVPETPYWIEMWTNTTKQNIALVDEAIAQPFQLDVVFLGDSITERWNGRDSGVKSDEDYNVSLVFNKLFHKASGGTMEGLALGVAGDRTQNLLYRLIHGEMPTSLNPKVWWLNIGTNNLGSDNCNADVITVGNIRIVEEIRKHNPETPIVFNSLLPRGKEELLHVNTMWPTMQIVNHNLECYAGTHDNLHFFNATDLFIYNTTSQEYGTEYYINQTRMHDYVHPSGEGSMIWGQKIVERLGKIIATEP